MTEYNTSFEYFVMEAVYYKNKTNEEIPLKAAGFKAPVHFEEHRGIQ